MANDERSRYGNDDRGTGQWRERNRGMFGYEGEGYMREGPDRGPWDEAEARSWDRWAGGRTHEPGERWDRERTDGGWNGRPSNDWHRPDARELDHDRERDWRTRNEMPDRTAGGRPLERHSGRDRVSDAVYGPDRGAAASRSFRGLGPRGYQRSDERVHEEVCERLAWDDDVDASDIEVAVTAATVTLTGTVHDRRMKRRAEDIAESVRGVADVQNHLHIDRGARSRGDDDALQSGVIGLASTENIGNAPASGRGTTGAPSGGGSRIGSAELSMTNAAASSSPITNPGAVSTGSSTSGPVTPNQGITSGNTSAGDRARRRNR